MAQTQEARSNNEEPLPISMTNFQGMYDIRDAKPEDKNFIMATFLKGLYYGDSWFSLIDKSAFMGNYKLVAEALLNRANIKIACLKEDPDVILGYSVLSQDYQTIHWVFVKANWRQKGIARSLLPQYPTTVTHLTKLGKELLPKFKTAVFNPFKTT